MKQLEKVCKDFYEILYWGVSIKLVDNREISLKVTEQEDTHVFPHAEWLSSESPGYLGFHGYYS
jgi:hypothetical protein